MTQLNLRGESKFSWDFLCFFLLFAAAHFQNSVTIEKYKVFLFVLSMTGSFTFHFPHLPGEAIHCICTLTRNTKSCSHYCIQLILLRHSEIEYILQQQWQQYKYHHSVWTSPYAWVQLAAHWEWDTPANLPPPPNMHLCCVSACVRAKTITASPISKLFHLLAPIHSETTSKPEKIQQAI